MRKLPLQVERNGSAWITDAADYGCPNGVPMNRTHSVRGIDGAHGRRGGQFDPHCIFLSASSKAASTALWAKPAISPTPCSEEATWVINACVASRAAAFYIAPSSGYPGYYAAHCNPSSIAKVASSLRHRFHSALDCGRYRL